MGVEFAADAPAEPEIEIWSNNWNTLRAFLDLQSQWRFEEADGRIWMSLDYGAADVVLRRGGYDDVDFADLQLMEWAAIDAFGGR